MAGGMDWFRWHHGTVSDPKFQLIAKRAKTNVAAVLAVWATLLEAASQSESRGNHGELDHESIDFSLGLDDGQSQLICAEMIARGILEQGGMIAAWAKRQVKRERDDSSAERVQAHRERKRQVTPGNANETQETPREEEKREELNNPLNPPVGGEGPVTFDGSSFVITPEAFEVWEKAYHRISLEEHIAAATAWVISNPKKRKKDWQRFLNNWLAKANKECKALDEGNCPVDKIIDLYHRECPSLAKVAVTTDAVLRGLIVERWNEQAEHQASTFWRTIFTRANRMPAIYYRGQMVMPRLELICGRSVFRQLEEQV